MPAELTWKEGLLSLLRAKFGAGEVFSLAQAYELAETLAELHPENEHVEDKVRQTLQQLRDDKDLSFEDDRGHYSLSKSSLLPGDPLLHEENIELRTALRLMRDLDGQKLTSERLQSLVKGFGGQKGIYKPSGSNHALWIRQTKRGVYPDKEIDYHVDGSWTYFYSPEGRDGKIDLGLDTNKGLIKCMEDSLPVGVFVQIESEGGRTRYESLGLAYVRGIEGDHFVLRGEPNDVTALPVEDVETTFSAWEVDSPRLSHVAKVLRDRRFGISLNRIYHGRCGLCNLGYRVSGRSVGLEAAHLIPVEEGGNIANARNGILLCRNHHSLFDQYAWAFDRDLKVMVAPDSELRESAVDNHVLKMEGLVMPNIPSTPGKYPAAEAIDWRVERFQREWR